jgi:histone-lysine N-methyltransferase SETD3
VFLCYGRHTQLELLELYGFMTAHNPHDMALLPVDVLQQQLAAAAAAAATARQQQQQQQGSRHHQRQQHQQHQQQGGQLEQKLDVAAADCWVHANGQPSWQLLSALR